MTPPFDRGQNEFIDPEDVDTIELELSPEQIRALMRATAPEDRASSADSQAYVDTRVPPKHLYVPDSDTHLNAVEARLAALRLPSAPALDTRVSALGVGMAANETRVSTPIAATPATDARVSAAPSAARPSTDARASAPSAAIPATETPAASPAAAVWTPQVIPRIEIKSSAPIERPLKRQLPAAVLRKRRVMLASGVVVAVGLAIGTVYLSIPRPQPPPPVVVNIEPVSVTVRPLEPPPVVVLEPVRFKNPFDAAEVFEFPAGTTKAEMRDAVAEILLERAQGRRGSSVGRPASIRLPAPAPAPAQKKENQAAPGTPASVAKRN